MRISRLRAIALAPVLAVALFGSGTDRGHAGQARGTLGVTVRVVASCSAALAPDSGTKVGSACPIPSAPLAIMTESAAPDASPASDYTAETEPGDADVRYLTLIY